MGSSGTYVYVASTDFMAAGKYIVTATLTAAPDNNGLQCALADSSAGAIGRVQTLTDGTGYVPLAVTDSFTLADFHYVVLYCESLANDPASQVFDASISAVQVSSLEQTTGKPPAKPLARPHL